MTKESLGFFRAIGKSQTYLNMLYLLFSFPFGLIYFIFIITGLCLGVGLFITLLGIPILLGVMYMWLGFAYFERKMSSALLNASIPHHMNRVQGKNSWEKLKKRVGDSATWKSFLYLMIKFPLGIFSFVVLITFVCVTLGLIATPFMYYLDSAGVVAWGCTGSSWCTLYNWPTAIFVGLVGIFMIFVSLAVFNGIAYVSKVIAKELLSKGKEKVNRKSKKKVRR